MSTVASGYAVYIGNNRMCLDGPILLILDEAKDFQYVDGFIGELETSQASQERPFAWSKLTPREIRDAIEAKDLERIGPVSTRWLLYRRQ